MSGKKKVYYSEKKKKKVYEINFDRNAERDHLHNCSQFSDIKLPLWSACQENRLYGPRLMALLTNHCTKS